MNRQWMRCPSARRRQNRLVLLLLLSAACLASALSLPQAVAQETPYSAANTPSTWVHDWDTLRDVGTTVIPTPPDVDYYGQISNQADSGVIQLGAQATADDPNFGDPGEFELRNRGNQTFSLSGDTLVGVPLYLQGKISFTGGSGTTHGFVSASSFITDLSDNSVKLQIGYNDSIFSSDYGTVIYDIFEYDSVVLSAGNYRLTTVISITGQADGDAFNNSFVNNDFDTGERYGAASVLSASPVGVGNSRTQVTAPLARQTYNVTGDGVRVGLVEPGRPYIDSDSSVSAHLTTHSSLAGRIVVPVVAGQDSDYRNEHAQATASIIASADADSGNAGVAPGATIYAAPTGAYANFTAQLNALAADNVRVINMSSGYDSTGATDNNTATVNTLINNNPNISFVKSAGNNGANITDPGLAYNAITVGALDLAMTSRGDFSSFGTTINTNAPYPHKPDLVAPGTYINYAATHDLDGNGTHDDFSRDFLGDDFDTGSVTVSGFGTTGTSFAAPHVSGALALMYEYYDDHSANRKQDHRALKAILLQSADTSTPKQSGGADWSQTQAGAGTAANPMDVLVSLDTQLGAGMLDTKNALDYYSKKELLDQDNNNMQHFVIDAASDGYRWDLETVAAAGGGQNGLVDYLLGDVSGEYFRSTLTWDVTAAGLLAGLQLGLFREGTNLGNMNGFDAGDELIAYTSGNGAAANIQENVKLIDWMIPNVAGDYYLQVFNPSAQATKYGIAIIPEPPSFIPLLLGLFVLLKVGISQRGAVVPFRRSSR